MLLRINAGSGNTDLGGLPASCIDLERGRLDHARVKTGIQPRCPLRTETISAVKAAVASMGAAKRPREESAEGLLVVTRNGMPYPREVLHADKGASPRSSFMTPSPTP